MQKLTFASKNVQNLTKTWSTRDIAVLLILYWLMRVKNGGTNTYHDDFRNRDYSVLVLSSKRHWIMHWMVQVNNYITITFRAHGSIIDIECLLESCSFKA
jgi:hypothetical protein